jgi:hypothetical protein
MRERSSTTVPASLPAGLMAREEALVDESRVLGETSCRSRLQIDLELCDIRRELERFGSRKR